MSVRLSSHASTYFKYFVVGAGVGILTVLLRELFALILPADTVSYYSFSIILAYAIGIVFSYLGHRHITFRRGAPVGGHVVGFSRFTLIAVGGLIATTVLSLALRYQLPLDRLLGHYSGGFAFAVATVLASVLTYSLNSVFTFSGHQKN